MEALMTEYASENSGSSSDDDVDLKESMSVNKEGGHKEIDSKLAKSSASESSVEKTSHDIVGADDIEKVELFADYFGFSNNYVDDDNRSAESQSKPGVENTANYFGLSNAEFGEEIREVGRKSKCNPNRVQNITVEGKLVTVEIPETNFWKDVESSEIGSFKDVISKSRRKDGSDGKQYKRRFQGRKVEKNMQSSGSGKSNVKTKQYWSTDEMRESKQHIVGEISDKILHSQDRKLYFIHPKIAPLLHNKRQTCRIPTKQEWKCQGHGGAVNKIRWNVQSYSHLFVTCSMDSTIKIWNIWSQLDPCVKTLSSHKKAVRDVEWSQDGKKLLSCSYDKTAAIIDVERGCRLCTFQHTCFVSCGKWHPSNPNLCVTGGYNQLQAWDIRTSDVPIRSYEYKDNFGQVLDILFLDDGSTFVSSSDLVSRDSADRNLMAWDFATGVTLSNQIYQERFTISRLQLHSQDGNFLAQSNGNYIAIFSTTRPYKMNRQKRFEGHKLLGYSLGFDVTPDGSSVVSGSSDGKLYCYNYHTGKLFRTLQTDSDVIMDLSIHPLLPTTLACCAWDGSLQVWK